MEEEKINFNEIEEKWKKAWREAGVFKAKEEGKKYYVLEMFPYPSGYGAHMGHARNYSIGDSFARFKRMQGYSVLYPMGWDAFGLPTENAAIKKGIHPFQSIKENIETMKKQFDKLSLSYDWDREINTSSPNYYKWTQWIFLKMYEKGLAYQKYTTANWCPSCKTTLANEDVKQGRCWRCGTKVVQKKIKQWFFKITDYADRLLEDLDKIQWSEQLKTMQRNWIGKSSGTNLKFKIEGLNEEIKTFTTRPDTYFGITFIAIAPEHSVVEKLIQDASNKQELEKFIEEITNEPEIDRITKEKKGIFTGKYAINPITGDRIELWLANYVVASYGTGAVIAVPAHDQRDFEFAKKHGIPIKAVISPDGKQVEVNKMQRAYTKEGIMINSQQFNGMKNKEAKKAITDFLIEKNYAERKTNYKIRDWNISRQRYWGAPIPVVYCEKCGVVPVPEDQLPVKLPLDVEFGKEGTAPLATNEEFVNTTCPKCGGPAKRETDTMTTFVDSSWYYLRYCSPKSKFAFDKDKVEYWMPVDQYIGGLEHAVGHLMYSRFVTKVLKDLGYLNFDEPFIKLLNQGMVLKDGSKMSKSKGNVVDPIEVIDKHGVDALRHYILSIAHPTKEFEWSDKDMLGSKRTIERIIELQEETKGKTNDYIESIAQSKIEKVTDYIEELELNSALLELTDFIEKLKKYPSEEAYEVLLKLMNPFTPHICEELWHKKHDTLLATEKWPEPNPSKINKKAEKAVELMEQLEGDIKKVMELAKINQPKKIKIFVAGEWKRKAWNKTRENKEEKNLIGLLMQDEEFKKHGKEATKYAQWLQKNKHALPETMNFKDELEAIEKIKENLSKEFNAEVEVINADESSEAKASNSMPNKPAILIE